MKKIVFLIGLIVLTGACTAPIERGGWEEEPYNALREALANSHDGRYVGQPVIIEVRQ